MYLFAIILLQISQLTFSDASEESCASAYVQFLNRKLQQDFAKRDVLKFNFSTNVTESNLIKLLEWTLNYGDFAKAHKEKLDQIDWSNFKDENLKRQIQRLRLIRKYSLPREKLREHEININEIKKIVANANFPNFHNASVNTSVLELIESMNVVQTPAELNYNWREWTTAIGPKLRHRYAKFVALLNESARLNGFTNVFISTNEGFEFDILDAANKLWEEIKPFYEQLHAYCRSKLREYFPSYISDDGLIPMHFLGDPFSESWERLRDISSPLKGNNIMFSEILRQTKRNRREVYEAAHEFFISMGFQPIPEYVWNISVFNKVEGVQMECFRDVIKFAPEGIRIIDCESVENLSSLPTAFLVISHMHKSIECQLQPFIYQLENLNLITFMVADFITIISRTKSYISKVTEMDFDFDEEDVFNSLFYNALLFLPTIPTSYSNFLWRYGTLVDEIKPENYNCEWWERINYYGGIEAPVDRSEKDFDVGAVPSSFIGLSFVDKFMARIFSFQLFKALCIKTNEYEPAKNNTKPLFQCDLYGKKIVGALLSKGLKAGRSKHWTYLLEVINGEQEIDSAPILEYFQPIIAWLKEQNRKNGAFIGWGNPKRKCVSYNNSEEDLGSDSYSGGTGLYLSHLLSSTTAEVLQG